MASEKGHNYFIGEGNKIGYLPTEFGENQSIEEKKIIAGDNIVKGQVVELTDSLTVKATSAASANVIGIAVTSAKKGDPIAVETEGLFKLVSAGVITAPTKVESAADGKVAAGSTNPIGIALNDAGTGEYVYVKFSI